jgi:hypothetical protein
MHNNHSLLKKIRRFLNGGMCELPLEDEILTACGLQQLSLEKDT